MTANLRPFVDQRARRERQQHHEREQPPVERHHHRWHLLAEGGDHNVIERPEKRCHHQEQVGLAIGDAAGGIQ
jgi:hypothetical protein